MANSKLDQGCLFEDDFLRRTLGAIANVPEVALTELVANAWDAGATEVKIVVPEELDEFLTIEDDGTGMSEQAFRQKWMTLGYDRIKHQGDWADFPRELSHLKRPAFGRNGVGRHGMLCFASEYEVKTWRDLAIICDVNYVDQARAKIKMTESRRVNRIRLPLRKKARLMTLGQSGRRTCRFI